MWPREDELMGQTPKYGLRFPERGDPAEAWTAVGHLAGDVEAALSGVATVPTPASGWAFGVAGYGNAVELRRGRVVTVDGMLRRTGSSLTLNVDYTVVPVLTLANQADPSRGFTGMVYMPLKGQMCRWYLAAGSASLGILHPGGTGTYTFATGDQVNINIRYLLAP
jgi:hypothetical protein